MAVSPSACGAFRSAFCCMSDCTAERSPFMAASATGLVLAPKAPRHNSNAPPHTAGQMERTLRARIFDLLNQTRQPARAIADLIFMDAVQIENTRQHVPGGNGLRFISQVAISLELPGGSANQNVRHVIMQVLVGVAHIGAIKDQRMIQ